MFRSTRPHGARRAIGGELAVDNRFRSTRPHGARLRDAAESHADAVSIHAPAWGATRRIANVGAAIAKFRSTRPHGARPRASDRQREITVSIHAPAWGATRPMRIERPVSRFDPRARMGRDAALRCAIELMAVSIHAPAWGATSEACSSATAFRVSIHAPAWGATCHSVRNARREGFDPRARMGRDDRNRRDCVANAVFRSTRPHGARRGLARRCSAFATFRSTRPHGARHSRLNDHRGR